MRSWPTEQQAAAAVGVPLAMIFAAIAAGELDATEGTLDSPVRVDPDSLDRWAASLARNSSRAA
jgi:hypothetical protein